MTGTQDPLAAMAQAGMFAEDPLAQMDALGLFAPTPQPTTGDYALEFPKSLARGALRGTAGALAGLYNILPGSDTEATTENTLEAFGLDDTVKALEANPQIAQESGFAHWLVETFPEVAGGVAPLLASGGVAGLPGVAAAGALQGGQASHEAAKAAGATEGQDLAATLGGGAIGGLGVLGPGSMLARAGVRSLPAEALSGFLTGAGQDIAQQGLEKATYAPEHELDWMRSLESGATLAAVGSALHAVTGSRRAQRFTEAKRLQEAKIAAEDAGEEVPDAVREAVRSAEPIVLPEAEQRALASANAARGSQGLEAIRAPTEEHAATEDAAGRSGVRIVWARGTGEGEVPFQGYKVPGEDTLVLNAEMGPDQLRAVALGHELTHVGWARDEAAWKARAEQLRKEFPGLARVGEAEFSARAQGSRAQDLRASAEALSKQFPALAELKPSDWRALMDTGGGEGLAKALGKISERYPRVAGIELKGLRDALRERRAASTGLSKEAEKRLMAEEGLAHTTEIVYPLLEAMVERPAQVARIIRGDYGFLTKLADAAVRTMRAFGLADGATAMERDVREVMRRAKITSASELARLPPRELILAVQRIGGALDELLVPSERAVGRLKGVLRSEHERTQAESRARKYREAVREGAETEAEVRGEQAGARAERSKRQGILKQHAESEYGRRQLAGKAEEEARIERELQEEHEAAVMRELEVEQELEVEKRAEEEKQAKAKAKEQEKAQRLRARERDAEIMRELREEQRQEVKKKRMAAKKAEAAPAAEAKSAALEEHRKAVEAQKAARAAQPARESAPTPVAPAAPPRAEPAPEPQQTSTEPAAKPQRMASAIRRRADAGYLGFRAWLAARGGLINTGGGPYRGELEQFTKKFGGKEMQVFGLGPVVRGPKATGGISVQDALSAAVEAGWLPRLEGKGSEGHRADIDDLLDLLDRNPKHPDVLMSKEYVDPREVEARERWEYASEEERKHYEPPEESGFVPWDERFSLPRMTAQRLAAIGSEFRRAANEGETTGVGGGSYAIRSGNPMVRALQRAVAERRADDQEVVHIKEQEKLASEILRDPAARDRLLQKIGNYEALTAAETIALSELKDQATERAMGRRFDSPEDLQEAVKEATRLTWAYLEERSEAGRKLGVIRDAMRSTTKAQKVADAFAETSEYLQRRIRKVRERMANASGDERFALKQELNGLLEEAVQENVAARERLAEKGLDPSADLEGDPYLAAEVIRTIDEAKQARGFAGLDVKGKVLEFVKEPLNLSKALMTAGDLSAVLRQGAFFTFGHPAQSAGHLRRSLEAMFSEKHYQQIQEEILTRPLAQVGDEAGLYLSTIDSTPTKAEEGIKSQLSDRIPVLGRVIRGSNRAFTSYLNLQRSANFDLMMAAAPNAPTAAQAKILANFANVASGRGYVGKGELAQIVRGASTVIWAPRLLVSRVETLIGQPLWHMNADQTAFTRKTIAWEYGRALLGLASVYALAKLAGAQIGKDETSSDFGKILVGNTRIDPLAGLSQIAVLGSRVAERKKTTMKGRVTDLTNPKYGEDSLRDVLSNFVWTKVSPAIGVPLAAWSERSYIGQPVTPAQVAGEAMIPLSFRDIYDAMKEHGAPEGAALGALSILGMGLQTYDKKKPQRLMAR